MNAIPKPDKMIIDYLKTYIEDGSIKVPKFQREFVWEVKKSAELLDSILKGYPIGTFVFWKTDEKLQYIKEIGGFELAKQKKSGMTSYILDGQQRITSLYACLKGLPIKNNDYSNIYINLQAKDDEQIVYSEKFEELDKKHLISFCDLFNLDLENVTKKYKGKDLKRISELHHRLGIYELSIINVENAAIDIATDIFTRINVTGKPLSVFEIMCAKIYDEKNNFDLAEKVKNLLEEWDAKEYETISTTTILQCIAICLRKSCRNKDILNLEKQDFLDNFEDIKKSMGKAIDYFKKPFGAVASKMLPYDALLVPFTYYFYNNNNKTPNEFAREHLRDYFWRCVLNQRFTEGVTGKLQLDIQNVIDVILKNEIPEYKEGVNISTKFLDQKGEFTTGSAISKGILCILSSKNPQSFKDGKLVEISNNWLSQSNSKNYHHFFPKKYMQNVQRRTDKVNHIANITILDSETNQDIKDKAPSTYIKKYMKNPKFKEIMVSHLIGDLEKFGILSDDYDKFYSERLKLYSKELKRLIKIRDIDILK